MRLSRIATASLAAVLLVVASPTRATAQMLPVVGLMLVSQSQGRACPGGSVVTGLRARVGMYVDAIGLRCRPVRDDGTLGGESSAGEYVGGTGGTERVRSCPSGTVASGQRIAVTASGHPVRIALFCRAWNASTRTLTGSSALLEVVNSALAVQITKDAQCPSADAPITRVFVRAGLIVDALGFVCNAP